MPQSEQFLNKKITSANKTKQNTHTKHFTSLLSLALVLGVCDTLISDGAVLSIKINMHFTSIYLVTGCWHGAQGEEASSEQGVSIGMSEVRTAKPDPSSR